MFQLKSDSDHRINLRIKQACYTLAIPFNKKTIPLISFLVKKGSFSIFDRPTVHIAHSGSFFCHFLPFFRTSFFLTRWTNCKKPAWKIVPLRMMCCYCQYIYYKSNRLSPPSSPLQTKKVAQKRPSPKPPSGRCL